MANNEKTVYTIPCTFSCAFCDEQIIEVRKYKGNQKNGIYGYTSCGTIIRPPKTLAKKIFAENINTKVHSANSTMQIEQEQKEPKSTGVTCTSTTDSTMQKQENKGMGIFDFFGDD